METEIADEKEESSKPDCYRLVADLDTLRGRLERAAAAYTYIKGYQRFHDEVRRSMRDDPRCAETLRPHLAERAFTAEAHTRLLCDDTLATLNELRDTGQLEKALGQAAVRFGRVHESPGEALKAVQEGLGEAWPELDTSFLGEAEQIFERQKLKVRPAKGKNPAGSITVGERKYDFTVSATPKPGLPGRVSREEFFGGTARGPVTSGMQVLVPNDCHHRHTISAAEHDVPIDAYTTFVTSLAVARESMYHHARKMDEVGPSALEGKDPVTAVIVAIIVIGAALVIAGATIEIGCATGAWTGSVCDWGWIMLGFGVIFVAGGICVAVGACELVVGVLMSVSA